MRIIRLHLRNVQRHADLEILPAPGFTVVRGSNESGKSTVRRAVELALYGRTGDAEAQVRTWQAEERSPSSVQLDVEADGDEETSFRVTRTFGSGASDVELQVPDGRLEGEAADRRLAELTGLPTLAFFRSTAVLDHADVTGLAKDDAALRERLGATVSAGDRALARNLRELAAQVAAIDGAGLPAPGSLAAAEAEIARLEGEVARGEEAFRGLLAAQGSLWAAQTDLAETDAQLESDRELLATSEEAIRLLAEQEAAESRHERFQRAAVVRDEIEKKESTHPSTLPLAVLRDGTARLRELESTIVRLTAELGDDVAVSGEIMRPEPRWRPFAIAAIVLAAIAVGAAAFTPLPIAAIVLAALALASAIFAFRTRRLAFDVNYQKNLREEQVKRRLRGRSVIEDQLRQNQKAREAQLAGLGAKDLAAVEELLAEEEAHVARLEQLHAEFASLLGDPPEREDVAVLRDRAAAEAEARRHLLVQMGEIGMHPAGHRARYDAAVAAGEAALARAHEAVAVARARVEASPADVEAVAGLAEALSDARLRRDRLARRRRILAGTLDALGAAEQATVRQAARFVERRMERDVERITNGRYRRVQVDDADLSIRLWSPERRDWVDARALSDSTLAMTFVSARLALARQVTGFRRPPLVLDDPFLAFDDERAARAVSLVRELAGDLQVLFLTSGSRYDAVADLVVELPAPTESDRRPAVAEAV
ncbi:MAG: ATP-binding protein [Candidatus Limnocylindrales bacterium]